MITSTQLGKNGRLGNQLFQINCILYLSKKYSMVPVIPEWEYREYFKNPLKTLAIEPDEVIKETEKDQFQFMDIKLKNTKKYDLSGYFQHTKYFDYFSYYSHYFEPSDYLLKKLLIRWGQYLKNSCSIHIRRTDYKTFNGVDIALGIDYYEKAIKIIEKLAQIDNYLVFSDDIEWCKNNFKHDKIKFVTKQKDIEDLFLMSLCNHNIIANSTFSWFGAFLGQNRYINKYVISPKKWWLPGIDTNGMHMPNWIVISEEQRIAEHFGSSGNSTIIVFVILIFCLVFAGWCLYFCV